MPPENDDAQRDDLPGLWTTPPQNLSLPPDQVHVWRAELSPDLAGERLYSRALAPDELARAERFHFPIDRARYIAARTLLRTILARYLDLEPGRIEFGSGAHGKPALVAPSGASDLRFNLSHSHGLALYAVGLEREVGVDLEFLDSGVAVDQLASRVFSPRELILFRGRPEPQRRSAFFEAWTRKEAYVKARGEGLLIPLSEVEVSLQAGPIELTDETLARWWICPLEPGPQHAGALAVQGGESRVARFEFGQRALSI